MAGDDDGRRTTPRIPAAVPAVVAVVVTAVLIAVVAGSTGDGASTATATTTSTTTTSTTVVAEPTTTTLPDAVPVARVLRPGLVVDEPASYAITYDVVENGLPRTEQWLVRRPYDALIVSERDGDQLSGTASSSTGLRTYLRERNGWLTLQPELHRASFDQRPAASLGLLEALGIVERIGEDEVLGRPCQVVRTGPTPNSAVLGPPTDEESTDLCIDDAGLVLREVWSIDGDVVVERTATALDLDVAVPDPDVFLGGETIPDADEFAAVLQTVAVAADEEMLGRLRTSVEAPAGYVSDATVFRATVDAGNPSSSELIRFFSAGLDLLEVSEFYGGDVVELADEAGARIAVDGWDEVWLIGDFRTAVVRARLDEYAYLELRHQDPAFLLDVLAAVTRLPR